MLRNGLDWLAVPACGVLGGLAGGLFSRIVILMARGLPDRIYVNGYPVLHH